MSPILALQMSAPASRNWAAPAVGTVQMNRPKFGQTCLLAVEAELPAAPKAKRTRFTGRRRSV